MPKCYDLVVVGGGFTGVAAAISSAREGLSVLLVEQAGYLGGAATNCLVNPFMRYWVNKKDENDQPVRKEINRGIFSTILNKLDEMGGLKKNKTTFNEEYIKLIFDRMCTEHGVEVLFHSTLIDVVRENNTIQEVVISGKSGQLSIRAKYFIDCTGDADLAFLAGCEYQLGRETDNLCQPMTLCFRLANIDEEKFWTNTSKITPLYQEFQKQGKIKNPRENVLLFDHMSDGVIHFNTTRIVKKNPVDVFDLSKAEMMAREQVWEMYHFLKENIEGCEDATLIMTAPNIGVRETRMIKGEYTITGDDLIDCADFEDSIACGSYGIDIHSPDGSGTLIRHLREDEYYKIPYRALIPQDMENLLVAGRCISSTHEAQSAYRVIPIVCCIGEGAGSAVVVACKENIPTRDVKAEKIHLLLDKYNALY